MWSTWLEAKESHQAVKFASVSQGGPSHEVLTKHSVWQKVKLFYQILYPHYKYSHYPQIIMSAFQRKNPSKYTWGLEIFIPTIIYTFPYGCPQLLPLYLYILERFITQTLTTPYLSDKWGFGAAAKYWNEPFSCGCNWAKLQDLES